MSPAARLRTVISRTWRPPTSKLARARLVGWLAVTVALIAVALYYVTQSDGLTDSSSCAAWLKATKAQQAAYVNGWARLQDYGIYGPEFTNLCRNAASQASSGPTDLGTIGQAVIDGHG